jgi:hypothetical protein
MHVRGDVNSWVRVTFEIHEHWSPTNNDDFTVLVGTRLIHKNTYQWYGMKIRNLYKRFTWNKKNAYIRNFFLRTAY